MTLTYVPAGGVLVHKQSWAQKKRLPGLGAVWEGMDGS